MQKQSVIRQQGTQEIKRISVVGGARARQDFLHKKEQDKEGLISLTKSELYFKSHGKPLKENQKK